jgi:translocation and assembly module TamB
MKFKLLRWMFYAWTAMRRSILVLIVLTVLAVIGLLGMMQLDVTKRYIAFRAEKALNERFQGQFRIGGLDGVLPFQARLTDLAVLNPDTVFHVRTVQISLSLADLISRDFRLNRLVLDRPDLVLEERLRSAFHPRGQTDTSAVRSQPGRWAIHLPSLTLLEGRVRVDTLVIDSIYVRAFAERNASQTYMDVTSARISVADWSTEPIRFSGQFFQDSRFTEINAIRIQYQKSSIRAGLVRDTALDTLPVWRFHSDSSMVHLPDLKRFWTDVPDTSAPVWISADGQGTRSGGEVRRLTVTFGQSRIDLGASIQNPFDRAGFTYDATIRDSDVHHADAAVFRALPSFPDLRVNGRIMGRQTGFSAEATLTSVAGQASFTTEMDWSGLRTSTSRVRVRALDLGRIRPHLPGTDIFGEMRLKTRGDQADLAMDLQSSRIGQMRADTLAIRGQGTLAEFRLDVGADVGGSLVQASVTVDRRDSEPRIRLDGRGRAIDLHDFMPGTRLAHTSLDMRFKADLTGSGAERIQGMASVDVDQAVVGGSRLKAHQFYVDLDSPDLAIRTLRFTSNVADATITGDIHVDQFVRIGTHWSAYLLGQLRRQFLLDDDPKWKTAPLQSDIKPVQLAIEASLKDLSLLNRYMPDLPPMGSRSEVNFLVSASQDRLLVNGGIRGDSIAVGTVKALESNLQISAQFRHGADLNDFSQVQVQLDADLFRVGGFEMSDYLLESSLRNDRLTLSQRANRIGRSTRFRNRISATLGDSLLAVVLDEFHLRTDDYTWASPGKPVVELHPQGRVVVRNFSMTNAEQSIDISGVFSASVTDSVVYRINRFDLGRVSETFGRGLPFDGTLSAVITTKSLTRNPTSVGSVTIDGFSLGGRTVGDVSLVSRLDPASDRFLTDLRIRTDSTKAAAELRRLGGVGNDIRFNGYVNTANAYRTTDTLFVWNGDIRKADLWIVELINPDLFERIEGRATGTAWLAGGTDWVDFDSRIRIQESRITPTFLLTDYTVSGPIRISRRGGLSLDSLQIRDRFNGRGLVYGGLDFNDFKSSKELNITMVLQNLQFLNNTFTNDVPFYGTAFGTGTFVLSGRTDAPFLQTRGQVITSANSRMSIPLLDETSVEEQARFVEFVSAFEDAWQPAVVRPSPIARASAVASNRFTELFTLNLSFAAPPGSTVQLVFDPLTGEVLNAQGSGSVQVRLEDQQFNVFGTFNVAQGDYTFVAGDIFLRKFDLRSGGTLVWEGPADNARLNVLAAYRSRPDISVLNPALDATRIPVDLMLSIGGTIQSIENDFYFEFPNNNDITQNASALSILNSDEQKLIQATSLLFTGGFIPTTGLDATQQGTLQARGLSLLLSSQVNALLGSRINNLDVDFNLSGFNQADLGVALRLFNDRLVLRGQSQFDQGNTTQQGGAQLGDLGATLRINRALSVEVFHRRDPTLRALASETETINGIGLEAQYQFNTWDELGQRMWASIRRMFGVREPQPATATATN